MMDTMFVTVPLEGGTSSTAPKPTHADGVVPFICRLEGWKTRCKNLHWSAPRKNIHVYLDEFLEALSSYQDSLAEEYQGMKGKLRPTEIDGAPCKCQDAMSFIEEVRSCTLAFYGGLPKDDEWAGVRSECEGFLHLCNKYKYLFGLCFKEQEG